jgi:hypothetical protein
VANEEQCQPEAALEILNLLRTDRPRDTYRWEPTRNQGPGLRVDYTCLALCQQQNIVDNVL